jgi:hypothetical protein
MGGKGGDGSPQSEGVIAARNAYQPQVQSPAARAAETFLSPSTEQVPPSEQQQLVGAPQALPALGDTATAMFKQQPEGGAARTTDDLGLQQTPDLSPLGDQLVAAMRNNSRYVGGSV